MAIGTPFHERTSAFNMSLDWREWAGYFAAGRYRDFNQPEYAAIRNGAALIDVSPLFKYRLRGPDAEALAERVFTRNIRRQKIGQVIYTPWCDHHGKVLQEGTLMRFAEDDFQLNAADPALGWLRQNAVGLEVDVEDRSCGSATLAVQGPQSRALLSRVADADIESLPFFHLVHGHIGGAPVVITRTGYTGDLGYEVWSEAGDATRVWDALMAASSDFGATPCGLKAMDISRVEAGFVLIGVDYVSAEHALIPSQLSSPYELGLSWAVKLKKKVPCLGHPALLAEKQTGSSTKLVGLEIPWEPLEALYAEAGLMPDLPLEAWRGGVPIYAGGRQVGRATSGCWSMLLKKYIAIASLETPFAATGSTVEMEVTVDYARKRAPARIVDLPFFRPDRLRA